MNIGEDYLKNLVLSKLNLSEKYSFMGNIPTLKLRSRLKNTASCNSSCCVETNSTSCQICRHCGSRVNLAALDSKKEFAANYIDDVLKKEQRFDQIFKNSKTTG